MKAKERALLLRQYGHLYRFHAPLGQRPGTCFYCGGPADTVDHCPPLSFADVLVRPPDDRNRVPFVLIAACSPCNLGLGCRALFRLIERVEFIRDKLSSEYEKKISLWPDAEIAEMSAQFARSIKARRAEMHTLRDRFRFAEKRALTPGAYPDE